MEVLTGRWIGSCDVGNEKMYCEVNWSSDDGVPRGRMTLVYGADSDLEVTGLLVEDDRASFALDHTSGCWLFEGALAGGQLQGTVSHPQGSGTFRLMAVADQAPESFDAFNGSYRLSPDRVIGIAAYRGEVGCPYPVCVDFAGGSLRALFPLGSDRFATGVAFMDPLPTESIVEFVRGATGHVTGLHWQETGQPSRWAPRIALRQEAVQIGGRDIIVPPDRNVTPMEQALQRAGNADHKILVFPDGDHVLTATQTGALHEIPFNKALVPGYLDALREWLVKHKLAEDV